MKRIRVGLKQIEVVNLLEVPFMTSLKIAGLKRRKIKFVGLIPPRFQHKGEEIVEHYLTTFRDNGHKISTPCIFVVKYAGWQKRI